MRRNVSISAGGAAIVLALKLGHTALLTRMLRIEDYGRVLIVLNLFVFLDSFFGLRVSDLMFRFFPGLKEREDKSAVKGLLVLCLGICLASGVIIYSIVFVTASWLGDRFYPNLQLAPLFRIYGFTIMFTSFSGVYEPILRVHNRFSSVVVPQVLGSFVTLLLLAAYFATGSAGNVPNLKIIVATFAVGALVQSFLPLINALRRVRSFFSGARLKEAMWALGPDRRAIIACLTNSNLSGYLKFATSPGDVFLLGLFAAPAQLAWYGLARQLTAPLAYLQANIQTAVTPEISSLVAMQRFTQLKRVINRYLSRSLAFGGVLLIGVVICGRFLILDFLRPEYAAALPVFYILAVAASFMLAFVVFRPLALNLDLLRWHNLALFASTIAVVVIIMTGRLSALTMAYVQLGEVLILRSLFGVIVGARLKRLDAEK